MTPLHLLTRPTKLRAVPIEYYEPSLRANGFLLVYTPIEPIEPLEVPSYDMRPLLGKSYPLPSRGGGVLTKVERRTSGASKPG